jgi:hypothetical protein
MSTANATPAADEASTRPSGPLRWILAFAVLFAIAAITIYLYFRFEVQPLPRMVVVPESPEIRIDGSAGVRYPNAVFVTRVATFRDELFAYLMYQHYKSASPFLNDELLLRYAEKKDTAEYHVLLVLTDDFIASVNRGGWTDCS